MVVKKIDLTYFRDRVPSKDTITNAIRSKLGKKRFNRDVLSIDVSTEETEINSIPATVVTVFIALWEFSPPSEYSDWKLAAFVSKEDSGTTTGEQLASVHATPEFEGDARLLKYFNIERFGCDHCHTNRLRKNVFVFFKGGEEKVIAKSCAKEYFNLDSVDSVTRTINNLKESLINFIEEDDFTSLEFSSGKYTSDNGKYINHDVVDPAIVYVLKTKGYTSQSSSEYKGGVATSVIVGDIVMNGFEVPAEYTIDRTALVEYWNTQRNSTTAIPFDHDCYISVVSFSPRMGVLCYAIHAYLESLVPKVAITSTHQGVIGEKIIRDVTVTFVKSISTGFGYSRLLKFVDAEGNFYSTFYSGSGELFGVEINQKIKIKGTIKSHDFDDYNERAPITALSRCKI